MKHEFEVWKRELVKAYVTKAFMTEEEAQRYVDAGDWESYFEDDYTPVETCLEDMSYWD